MSEPIVHDPPASVRPPTTGSLPLPVALTPDPRAGWRRAGTAQRVATASIPAVLLLWPLCLLVVEQPSGPGAAPDTLATTVNAVFTVVWLLGAPPAFFAAARILRPYPAGGGGRERVLRHSAAALAAAYGTLMLASAVIHRVAPSFNLWPEGIWLVPALVAPFLAVITLVWGAVAATVRSAHGRAPQG